MPLRPTRTRRTKVYDCNYDIGQRYYKPVVDDLERKYSGRASSADGGGGGLGSLRSALDEAETSLGSVAARRAAAREASADDLEDAGPRRRPLSSLMDEFDNIYEGRGARRESARREGASSSVARTALASLDDEEDVMSSRVRAARARAAQIEDEFSSSISTSITSRKAQTGLNYSEKVLDTVGLKNSDITRARQALNDDSFSSSKRTLKISSQPEEGGAYMKWTKLQDADLGVGADDDFDSGAAAARARKKAKARLAEIEAELGNDFQAGAAADRARKSRARLADLEAEMEAVADRSAARERRAAGLRALVAENETAAAESSSSTTTSALRVRKVTSSVQSEKKTVTF